VTPGLADMHNHLRDGTFSQRPQALGNARRLLAFGVTTIFFPNANLQLLARLKERRIVPQSSIQAFTGEAGAEQFNSFLTNTAFTKTRLPTLRANLKKVNDAGILIVAGTDTGFSGVFPGLASHLELILHAEAGLKTADIINAATINAARMVGREKDSGTIEEGKVADLLILDANPLDDIRNIKRIHRVIKSGTVFDPAELLKR
jgi:imidazolonepropionase-like amidohydrolase